MIELEHSSLLFSFPDVHPEARLRITFKRTLRVPDDDTGYPLPPSLGDFPMRHADDFADKLPRKWIDRGGVILPMYQSEAMWIDFRSSWIRGRDTEYPFAIKIATGKINAVSGEQWSDGLREKPQNYVVVPEQPWIDGYRIGPGVVRQFVAMPLGKGYGVEEQLTGQAEYGGIQVQVFPMPREVFEQRFPQVPEDLSGPETPCYLRIAEPETMSLAPGGRIRQSIWPDPFEPEEWDLEQTSRCFVHLVNSVAWKELTGQAPPTWLPTAAEYTEAGLPWFEEYRENPEIEQLATRRPPPGSGQGSYKKSNSAVYTESNTQKQKPLPGSGILDKLKSVFNMGQAKGEQALPENKSAQPGNVMSVPGKNQVREGKF